MSSGTQWRVQAVGFATLAVVLGIGLVLEFQWVRLLLFASCGAWFVRCLAELRHESQ